MVTRAMELPARPVSMLACRARAATAPTATTAPIASRTARTRQKVSLRRIRRRSTMVSASSDMTHLLDRESRRSCPAGRSAAAAMAAAASTKSLVSVSSGRLELVASSSSAASRARLSAVPRMSPSVAPESEEPYWAIASFSSATSSALIETCTLWARRSNWMTRASTFWPTAKRSGRCSPRSRASSERLMKVVRSVPTIFTSRPPSFTSVTSQVTTAPFLSSPAALGDRIALELLDAERDALLLDVDVEHLRLDHVALLVLLDHLLARTLPVEVGEVHHAVDVAVEAEEQAELGLVLDLAFDHRAGRIFLDEHLPRIAHGLLEAERDAALDRIDLEDLHLDLLRGGDDLAGMHVLLGPRHFGDVDQALDAGLELHERAVVGDVGDAALEARADRIFGLDALPRIVLQLLHAERDAVGLVVDLDDLDLHLLADVEHFGRVIDAPPRDVGDVQQAVDAAEIDERAVVGDVLDHAVDDLALFEVLHQLLALLGAGLFQHGAARHDDVAAAAIHLEDLERLRLTFISGVTSRIGRMSTC